MCGTLQRNGRKAAQPLRGGVDGENRFAIHGGNPKWRLHGAVLLRLHRPLITACDESPYRKATDTETGNYSESFAPGVHWSREWSLATLLMKSRSIMRLG
jgi:hypothetical protein